MQVKTKGATCQCGCEQATNLDPSGLPRKFLRGHNRRGIGKGWIQGGYEYICHSGRHVAVHRLVAEARAGRPLGRTEVVHHVDHNRLNNDPANLVVLSLAEHTRLHRTGTRGRHARPEERERAKRLVGQGMRIQEVADILRRPHSTVAKWVAPARRQDRELDRTGTR